jgi:ATP-dependent helicase HrpB
VTATGLAPLPIDPLLPELVKVLRKGSNLVLLAEPGAGKTTRMPRALLDAGLLEEGECWVLEPRRLAARLAARRVAQELGEEVGSRVGYAVRFEQRVSAQTRIRFVTEGLLLRKLHEDPELKGITYVLLDEFHERHLHTDLALTLLRRLQRESRPDLGLAVMSATLDPTPVSAYLDAPVLEGRGRVHPVELAFLPRPDDRPLPQQVVTALEGLLRDGSSGHILVFLPGAAEIRACSKACESLASRLALKVLPLHGDLSAEAQETAVAPSDRRKIILSTNVAESSVTLDGIAAVVDSGQAREAFHSPWSGLSGLRTVRISQARAVQRAGRAGRTGPGRCLRLYTEADFKARAEFDPPEIRRVDLAESLLLLHGLGLADPASLDWFEAPPPAALRSAETLLRRLGALAGDGTLSPAGQAMASLPLHPRLAKLVVAADELGIPRLGRLAAVLLEAGDLQARRNLESQEVQAGALDSDLLSRLDRFHEAEAARFDAGALRAAALEIGAVHQAHRSFQQLSRGSGPRSADPADAELRLQRALLRAYPDRVARRSGTTLSLVGGGGAVLDPRCQVRRKDLLVALEADQAATGGQVRVKTASAIEADWLLEDFPEAVTARSELRWNSNHGRVERFEGLYYEDLCFDEGRRAAKPGESGVGDCLAAAIREIGLGEAQVQVDQLLDRIGFLRRLRPGLGLPDREELSSRLLLQSAQHCASLADLARADWAWALRELIGEATFQLLERLAPEQVPLPKRRVAVNYAGEAPWIASRLQDFLGLREGPRIGGGEIPLVLHLLAPNQRAVQVTTDLAGFWQRAYRELRPQLSRRYPRHNWPEDPVSTPS